MIETFRPVSTPKGNPMSFLFDDNELPYAYLAGPDVFRPDSAEHGRRLVAICAKHGIIGLYPDDDVVRSVLAAMENATGAELARAIFRADIAKVGGRAHGIIANLTPFRSPSADPGTTMELGVAFGQSKPVFCYSSDLRAHDVKVREFFGVQDFDRRDGKAWAPDGMMIDELGETDNLMMTQAGVGAVVHPSFEAAVIQAAQTFRMMAERARKPRAMMTTTELRGIIDRVRDIDLTCDFLGIGSEVLDRWLQAPEHRPAVAPRYVGLLRLLASQPHLPELLALQNDPIPAPEPYLDVMPVPAPTPGG